MSTETNLIKNVYAPVFEAALLKDIEAQSVTMQVPAGQVLMNMGQPIKMVPLVLSGTIKITRINEEAQELLLYYVREGEGCAMTFSCGMMGQASLVKGIAEDDLTMLVVPVTVMDEWMQKYPSWKKFVLGTIVNEFTDVIKSVDDVTFKKMDERLVSYLKEKWRVTGSAVINLTHQQISEELGTHRVVVSRLLKKLEIDGRLILYRNQIKLLKDL